MKPITLTMQAFGPYKYKEVVDFTELQNNRLFLVSGNTGAGKTTIFDGIAFALYGFASGEDRKEHKSMRSDFAEDDTHTFVELVFETRGRKYRVARQLAHVKKGRKTASGENFEFMEILADGTEVKASEKQKSKEISQKIEELIGLTYDQFHQIVMLPQGEFRKLLTSSTENKEAILRKIFKTERYSKIAEKLEHKKKEAEKKRDEAKTVRDMYIDQITGALPERESLLFERVRGESNIHQIIEGLQEEKSFYIEKQAQDEAGYEQAQQGHAMKQQQYVTFEQQNERLVTLQRQQQQLTAQIALKPQYDAFKKEAEQGNVALQISAIFEVAQLATRELKATEQTLVNLHQQNEEAKEKLLFTKQVFDKEHQTEQQRKQLEQSMHELTKIIPLFQQASNFEREIQASLTSFEQTLARLNACKEHYVANTSKLSEVEQRIEQYQQRVQLLPDKHVRLQSVEHSLKQLQQFEQLQQLVGAEQLATKQSEQQTIGAEQVYNELQQMWVNNQAVQLASHLVDGEPCPVCGSKVHDAQHVLARSEQVSKEALQQAKQKYDLANQAFYNAKARWQTAELQLQQLEQHMLEGNIDVTLKDNYVQEQQALKVDIQQIESAQQALVEMNQKRKQLVTQIEQLQLQQQGLSEQQQQEMLMIETKKVELSALQKQIPASYPNLQLLQAAIAEQKTLFDQLMQAFLKAQQQYEQASIYAAKLQEAVYQTEQQLEKLGVQKDIQQMKWEQALTDSPFSTIEQFKEALRSRQQIEQLQLRVTQFMQQLFALQQFVERESEQMQGVELVDLTELQQQVIASKELAEQAYKVLMATKDCIHTCEKYEQNLHNVAEKIAELEDVANNILNLYNVLRGQNAKKISFERYVQIGYLEQITAAANARLLKLSNGQYKLVSSERQLSHGRQSGLSLDVHDSYTDQVRDVKTLSGGEKFNASLCLALGMADVIQSYEGNVRIDTMFIDEGFGSLDEESLHRAIDTLVELQKSGRMIGIISHVAELKAAIPAVIEVLKLKEGYSKTKISIT